MGRSLTQIEKIVIGCAVGVFAVVLAVMLQLWGLLGTTEKQSLDWRARQMAEPASFTGDIVIIVVDRSSLDWAAAEQDRVWPWRRELFAGMVDYCREAGARVVALDLPFEGPSPFGSADDQALQESLFRFGRWAVAPRVTQGGTLAAESPAYLRPAALTVDGMDEWLSRNPAGAQSLSHAGPFIPDPDGAVRRIRLFGLWQDHVVPQLGLAAYLAGHPEAALAVGPGSLRVNGRTVPIDELGLAVLRVRGPSGVYQTYAAADVLRAMEARRSGAAEGFPAVALKDAYVFIAAGFAVAGAPEKVAGGWDYLPVEIQATMLDNLLAQDFLQRAAPMRTIIIMFFFCCLCGVCVLLAKTTRASLVFCVIFAAIPFVGAFRSYQNGLWLPLVVIETALLLAVAVSLGFRYAFVENLRRSVRRAFSDVVSPSVSGQLQKEPEKLVLQGRQQMVTAFIAGLDGFDAVRNTLEPERLSTLLNECLTVLTDAILGEDGTIDRYDGATVTAFWNAPLEVEDHAARAARAAIACRTNLWHAREFFRESFGLEGTARIGIHTGPAVVGNMGSRFRMAYTMIRGPAADKARTLHELNSLLGTHAIMSSATRELIGNVLPVRTLGRIEVEPDGIPETLYEPISPRRHVMKQTQYAEYAEGLELYYAGEFAKARAIFIRLAEQDPVAAAYARQCAALMQAPPVRWDGVLEIPGR
jgi:adenylate cyclase